MKKGWKFWVGLICWCASFVVAIMQKDFTLVIWIICAGLGYFGLNYIIPRYEFLIKQRDDLIENYWTIIQVQSDRIKELENGKDREDSSDSRAGVVAEEALQAHEE